MNRVLEKGIRETQVLNSTFHAGVRHVTPCKQREQEKRQYDICLMNNGELAYVDIGKIDALAYRKSLFISKEMIQKNIEPIKKGIKQSPPSSSSKKRSVAGSPAERSSKLDQSEDKINQ